MKKFGNRAGKLPASLIILAIVVLSAVPLRAQDKPLWLRYPAISPDGQTVLFCYKGNIYKVPAAGGQAYPLTISAAYDYAPVWSHDGKSIAFASDRFGNFDVFVMPASGGEAKRLTYHSAAEIPSSFTADDKNILFSSARQDTAANVQFPMSVFPELYSVPVTGGEASLVLTQPAIAATVNPAGDKIIYHDQKGYESDWRKHHISSVTRDIWVYDLKTKKNTQLTTFKGEDRNPVFDSNGDDFYYLSEQKGSFNVFKSSLSKPAVSAPVTDFTRNPVRFLSRSKTGVLCFGYDGEIYTMTAGAAPRRIDIRIAQDGRQVLERTLPIGGGVTEMRLSPNGKEIAYVFRGEIFVGSVEGGVTKRITNTPWQERSVSFSPDGRTLVYAAERDNSWNIYTTSIVRKEEPYFYASTVLKEDTVVATPAEEFQPEFSPDGKEVAYLENRVVLKVVNLVTKQTRTILPAEYNYSYQDGDQYFKWSPDGKWFLVQFAFVRLFTPQIGLVSSDGRGKVIDLTKNGFGAVLPRWGMDGSMMFYGCAREGAVNTDGSPVEMDVYATFFTRAAYDRFRLSKEDFALLKEQEDKAKEDKDKAEKDKPKDPKAKDGAVKPDEGVIFDLDFNAVRSAEQLRRGVQAFHRGFYSDALVSFEKAISYKASNSLAQRWLGRTLWKSGFEQEAIRTWNQLVASNAGDALLRDWITVIGLRRGLGRELDSKAKWVVSAELNGNLVGGHAFKRPTSVRARADGTFWVVAFGSNEVLRFDGDFKLVAALRGGVAGFDHPYDVQEADDGTLFVSEYGANRVAKCKPD
ncbi:MAG: hypothetical protein ABSA30_04495, partial [Candidatus Aminicenantales bacterium]